VIEIAEELVEAVHRRQVLVAVAEVVLAELAGGVAEGFQHVGDGGILRPQSQLRARHPDLGQAGADRRLAGNEGGPPGGAALLAVPVGEDSPFPADAVDIGRAVAHDSHVVGADIEPADVVSHDEQDVGPASGGPGRCRLLRLRGLECGRRPSCRRSGENRAAEQKAASAQPAFFRRCVKSVVEAPRLQAH
jgi:hypothetical protein